MPFVYAAVEPHITITMDAGQTTNPLEIKDSLGSTVFGVDSNGDALYIREEQINGVYDGSIGWQDTSHLFYGRNIGSVVNEQVTTFAESGAGVYQWSHEITSNDMPSGEIAGFNYLDYHPSVTMKFQTADDIWREINFKMYVNDVLITSWSSFLNSPSQDYMSTVSGETASIVGGYDSGEWSVGVGDTVSIKWWAVQSDSIAPIYHTQTILWISPAVMEVTDQSIHYDRSGGFWLSPLYPDLSGITPTPSPYHDTNESMVVGDISNPPFGGDGFFTIVQGTRLLADGVGAQTGVYDDNAGLRIPAAYDMHRYIRVH